MGNCCATSNHVCTDNKFNTEPTISNVSNNSLTVDSTSNNSVTIRRPSDIWTRLQSSPQIGDWLKNVPIFCRVPEDKRNKVGGVMETMIFKSGEHVFQQGDVGDRFYIIKQGTASVTISMASTTIDESINQSISQTVESSRSCSVNSSFVEREVARLKQGDYFGETALLSKAKRNATITAVNGDLITLTLDSSTFKKLFRGLNVQLAKRKGVTEENNMTDYDEVNDTVTDQTTMKSDADIRDIVDILNSSVLFQRLNIDQKKQIAESMWKKEYGPNQEIGNKGEILSNLYIVKKGTAVKFIERKNKTTKEIMYEREELTQGTLIGEIGLMYNSPLQCTYKTNCDNHAEFWLINRKKFRQIVKDSSKKKLTEFDNFIKTVPTFACLLEYERKRIAETLEEIHFKNNHAIVKQGDIGDTFYIVRKGTAVVHKYEGDDTSHMDEVARLGPGDFFGERALIKNDVRAATVTVTSVEGMECLMLDREGFILLLGPLGDIMKRKIDKDYDGISISIEHEGDNLSDSAENQDLSSNTTDFGIAFADLSVIGTLGKGSFGHVELVQAKKHSDDHYALKTVHKSHVIELGQQEHMVNEKRVLMCLSECPFIVKLYATFKDEESVYFLLEPVLGGELFALLRDRSAFDETTSAFYAACVVQAFAYMHSKHIIYRDLKPENLLLNNNGYLKITDYGFAKFVTDRTWTLCGTPDYLAPEVVSGIGHNKAVDWWTLGILVYEMISSYPPFYDDDPMQTYAKIMHGNIDYPLHFSKHLIDFIQQLLQPKPTKRLGIIKGGVDNIKMHAWFRKKIKFNWNSFEKQQLIAPYIPNISGPKDLSNFEEYSDEELLPTQGIVIDDGTGWDQEF